MLPVRVVHSPTFISTSELLLSSAELGLTPEPVPGCWGGLAELTPQLSALRPGRLRPGAYPRAGRCRWPRTWVEWFPTFVCRGGSVLNRQTHAGLLRFVVRLFTRHGSVAPVIRTFSSIFQAQLLQVQLALTACEFHRGPRPWSPQSSATMAPLAANRTEPKLETLSFRRLLNRVVYQQPGGTPRPLADFHHQHLPTPTFVFELGGLCWGEALGLRVGGVLWPRAVSTTSPHQMLTWVAWLMYLTYRVRYCALDRHTRKLVKCRYRYTRMFLVVPTAHRLRYGLRFLPILGLYRRELTWGQRIGALITDALFLPQQASVYRTRVRHQQATLRALGLV